MFTELQEEFRPGNFQLPVVRRVEQDEWLDLTNNWHTTPDGYCASQHTNTNMLCVFAEANHVEFIDLFTGKLCLPPEMFLLKLFKAMAKSNGPFVAIFQFGYRVSNQWPYQFSPVPTEENPRRVLALVRLVHRPGFYSDYDWRHAYQQRAARALNIPTHDASAGVHNLETAMATLRRNHTSSMLCSSEEYIVYIPDGEA